MRKIDAQDELQSGIDPSPGPSPQPDGLPGFSPKRPDLPPRPRLCEQGPCRNYHRLETQVESADPRAQRVPVRLPVLPAGAQAVQDGTLYQAPATFHTSTAHYCYPAVGIEITLGDTPVVSCSRWDPLDKNVVTAARESRERYLASDDGRAYLKALAAWESAREAEDREDHEALELIADALVDAQLERYAFAAVQVGEASGEFAGDPIFRVSCDALPTHDREICVSGVSKAIEMHRDAVADALHEMFHRGTPFPEPPIAAQIDKYGVTTEPIGGGGWRARVRVGGHHFSSDRASGPDAISAVVERASAHLRALYEQGIPFPEPPPKENQ